REARDQQKLSDQHLMFLVQVAVTVRGHQDPKPRKTPSGTPGQKVERIVASVSCYGVQSSQSPGATADGHRQAARLNFQRVAVIP
ncbi:MAG: hypothetical protein AAF317_13865, partial [Pseudomonadota bacterium]